MKKLLIGLAVLVVIGLGVLVAVGLALPTRYEIEKRVTIGARPEAVHALVGDLKRWPEWTPWQEDDPSIHTTYGEKTEGAGASQTWTSDGGDGELTITTSDPKTGITYDMVFIDGDTRAPARCAMLYREAGESTEVVWTMQGDVADFMPPVLSGLMTPMMKGMIGEMFDRGLSKLRATVESGSPETR
jgi:hypothetical protein